MHKKAAAAAAAAATAAICMDFISASGCISNEQHSVDIVQIDKLPNYQRRQLIQIQIQIAIKQIGI